MPVEQLASLHRGFRSNYLRYDELVAQLRGWAEAFPELVCLRSIGETPEGRALWVVTIGRDPDRRRPSVWVDGNMHATELAGSSVALAIAEDLLRLHLTPKGEGALHELSAVVRDRLGDVLVHVLPRMCPDGAEQILESARYVRSNPRDRRPNKLHSRWIAGDVDGDGLALVMRKVDPTGEFVEAADFPGLLVPRMLDDAGPYYKVYPEGHIENWDGSRIPNPNFLADNDVDLNRNFPYDWAPEPKQAGAGAFPTSEPESRAVVQFIVAHPEIFAWLNLHTFGGCFIRPLGDQPDKKMDFDDRALFRQLEAWAESIVGYPMVSGYEEFLYEPDKPLRGDLTEFGYHQRGAISYVCELWDLFARIGVPRKTPFVDHYAHLTREQLVALASWDAKENAGRVVRPWKKVVHPQLGDVEVGGIDGRVGMSNPSYEALPEVCAKQASMFLRVAALAPAVVVSSRVGSAEGDVRSIDVRVENHGYLPTYVLSSAKEIPWNEPLFADALTHGCALVDPSHAHREVGHLDGWGRGLYGDGAAIFYQRSRGSTGSKTLRYLVRGGGTLVLRVGSCRVGVMEHRIEI